MTKDQVKELQAQLYSLGLYDGEIDGIYGDKTTRAVSQLGQHCPPCQVPPQKDVVPAMPWGSKVSGQFRRKVAAIAEDLKMPPEGAGWLMACMAFETGRSFSPSVKNGAGSSGTGLIQFMAFTARGMGTTVEHLAKMTAVDQLEYVYRYFKPQTGKLKSLEDTYMAILWPRAVGKPLDYVLWAAGTTQALAYKQNRGFDFNKDGKVVKSEVCAKIQAIHKEGFKHVA